MRIAHVIDSMDPSKGGPPAVVARLAAAQAAAGHDVLLFAHDTPARRAEIEASCKDIPGFAHVRVTLCAPGGFDEALTARTAKRALERLLDDVDILHLHGVWCRIVSTASDMAVERSVPYVVAPHGVLHPWCLAQKRWKKRLALALGQRRMLNRAAFIHALNRDEVQVLRKLGLSSRVEVIPNGVFPEELDNLPARGSFRRTRPALGDRPFVLFLSRLHIKKGLDYLAEAFRQVATGNVDVHLVVAGPDDGARADFMQRVESAGLQERVHVVGPLYGRDKYAALVDARCFCLPSRAEGFSMAVVEALGCGLPVVISHECNFPEVAEHSAGMIVDLDAAAIGAALSGALNDNEWYGKASRAARTLAMDRYTWPVIAEHTIDCYQNALPVMLSA